MDEAYFPNTPFRKYSLHIPGCAKPVHEYNLNNDAQEKQDRNSKQLCCFSILLPLNL